MAAISDKINPGDVISSDLFNRIIALLNEHDSLLSGTVGTGPLDVQLIQPIVLRMGEELTVTGTGLHPSGLKTITIDGNDVSLSLLKPASGSGMLVFDVPTLLGISNTGKNVTLVVTNKANVSDSGTFYLLPGVSNDLTASFTITRTLVSPGGNLAANTAYDFTFSVEAFTNRDETYLIQPKLIGAPAGWVVAVKGGGTEIPIPKSQPTPSTTPIVITVTTGAAGGGTLSLDLKAKNFAGITGGSMGEPIAIGSTPGAPNLEVEFMTPFVIGPVHKFSNGALYVKTDASAAQQFAIVNPLNVRLKTGGIYTIGTPVVSNNAWNVTVTNNPKTFDTTGTPNAIKNVTFTVAAQLGAPDADLEIPITGAGALPDGSFKCKLKLRADPANPNPL